MSKRANLTTQEYLINAPLPQATATYTVIPHKDVIDLVKKGLAEKGFGIERELYRCNLDAQVAQGVYHLKYGNDPDMGLMFAWSNSYDKSMSTQVVRTQTCIVLSKSKLKKLQTTSRIFRLQKSL